MNSCHSIISRFIGEIEASRPVALCVVVEKSGSTPQVPGAMMIVDHQSQIIGTIGGGCVEAAIRREAFNLLQQKVSRLVEIDLDHETATDDGMICGGSMKIAIVTTLEHRLLKKYGEAVKKLEEGSQVEFPVFVRDGDSKVKYVLHLETDPELIIAGAGHISQEVARLAVNLGFKVTVIDNRGDFSNPVRFPPPVIPLVGEIDETLKKQEISPSSYVVIVTRGHKHDQSALEAVMSSPAKYIGMIGSKRKVRMIFDAMKEGGIGASDISKVHAPIGVSIHAVTVEEIAISIMAELIRVRRENWQSFVEGPIRT